MGRYKITNKKVIMSLTINKLLNDRLEKFLNTKNLSKSEYIEYLIKKEKMLNNSNNSL